MPDPQKTLVILTPAFPADEKDSAWVPSKQLFVKKLQVNFPEVKIIVLAFSYPQHVQQYTWHGVQVIPFDGMGAKKLKRLRVWRRVWNRLSTINKQQTITGIYSFWCGPCALVGHYFAKRNGIKHFCWISGMDALKTNKLVKFIRPKAEELVAMSLFLEKEFEKNHGIKPAWVIPIGIDPAEFDTPPPARDIDIMAAGNFNDFKQYDLFVRVVKAVSVKNPGIKAIICGDGTERENLEKLIEDLDLGSNITLLGMKPHGEVLQWMQRSKIFIHPSAYEGFGAVCIEALYAGAQVISFCDPMQLSIPEWHIVRSEKEMTAKAAELLATPTLQHHPVLVYDMNDTAKAVMNLF